MKILRTAVATAFALACLAAGPAFADNMVVKDGNGAAKTVCSKTQTSVEHPCHVLEGQKPDGTFAPIKVDTNQNVVTSPQAPEASPGSNATKAFAVQGVAGGQSIPVQQPAFTPTATAPLAVSTSSARVALPSADATAILINTGTADVYYLLGNSSVAATTSSFLLPVGTALPISVGSNTHIAAITATGTSSLSITTGPGQVQIAGGVGANASNAVTAADCGLVTVGCKIDGAWDLASSSPTLQAITKAMALKIEATRALLAGTLTVTGPLTNSQLTAAALATAANQTTQITAEQAVLAVLGAKGDTVCASDTGSCSLNAQMQQQNQKITALNSKLDTLIAALGSASDLYDGTNGKTVSGYTRATADAANSTSPTKIKATPSSASADAITPISSTAAESCHVLKASAGNLYSASGYIGAAGFIMVFNSTSAPADGAVTPVVWLYAGAAGSWSLNYGLMPAAFSTGITVCASSTGPLTKTAYSTNTVFSGNVQ